MRLEEIDRILDESLSALLSTEEREDTLRRIRFLEEEAALLREQALAEEEPGWPPTVEEPS